MTDFYCIVVFLYICCPFGALLFLRTCNFSKLHVNPKVSISFCLRSKNVPILSSFLTKTPLWSSSIRHVSTALRCGQITSLNIGFATLMRKLSTFPPTEMFLKYSSATSVFCHFCLSSENQSYAC